MGGTVPHRDMNDRNSALVCVAMNGWIAERSTGLVSKPAKLETAVILTCLRNGILKRPVSVPPSCADPTRRNGKNRMLLELFQGLRTCPDQVTVLVHGQRFFAGVVAMLFYK